MAQTKSQIQQILTDANTAPRHRFGQNFMIDANMVRLIADAGAIAAGDVVIEVGPGTGTLTDELLARASRVVAVEIDRDLAGALRARLGGNEKFTLIEGDALDGKHALNEELAKVIRDALAGGATVKLVANLPYNIASPLVVGLLLEGVSRLVFTVQKEVADRLRAKADTDDFGPLTAVTQLLARVEVMRTLPSTVFWPPPKIASALVRLDREDRLGDEARAFSRFVSTLFSFRRKTLRKALEMSGVTVPVEIIAGREGARAESFSPEELLALFRASVPV